MSFLLDNCTFRELTPEVIQSCGDFSCKHDSDINDFFHTEFKNYSDNLLGKSYCFIENTTPEEIVCAFTVANSSIKVSGLPNKKRNKINRSIPHSKRHSQYPAVLVGQLAVFDKYKGHNIGKELMDFIKSWFIDPLNKTGCRYIVVDAINQAKVRKYYEDNFFKYIFSSDEEEMQYMSHSTEQHNIFQRIKYKFCPNNMSNNIFRRTRLMFFDLIVLYSKE